MCRFDPVSGRVAGEEELSKFFTDVRVFFFAADIAQQRTTRYFLYTRRSLVAPRKTKRDFWVPRRMHNSNNSNLQTESPGNARKTVSRRAMLKGATAVMPAVLTLQSGAALARSSNLISAARYDTTDRAGRTLCLDLRTVYPVRGTGKYDLGEPPYARMWAINPEDHRIAPDPASPGVSEAEMCRNSGVYYHQVGTYDDEYDDEYRWREVKVPYQGIVVSVAAARSLAGALHITNI